MSTLPKKSFVQEWINPAQFGGRFCLVRHLSYGCIGWSVRKKESLF